MPDNFKYIETKVKPSQCTEIAARNAMGEYLIPVADDCIFTSDFLLKLYDYSRKIDSSKHIIGFRFININGKYSDKILTFNRGATDSPDLGVTACYRKDLWHKLGGIDRRFLFNLADIDMQMRFFEYGLTLFRTPDCALIEEKVKNIPSSLYLRTSGIDRALADLLWIYNAKVRIKRNSPVLSFDDKDLLLNTQGNVLIDWV